MGANLFVGGFPYELTEEELGRIFAACGKVVSAKILTERDTRRSRGLAFILMEDEAAAQRAIQTLNGTDVGHRKIFVTEAKPPEKAQGGYAGPERRSGEDRRKAAPAAGKERRAWDKKPWDKDRKPRAFGDKKPWEKKPWDKDSKPRAFGDKKPWEKKPWSKDQKPGAEGKKPWEKKPWDKDGKPRAFGDKKPWEKKPWSKDQKPGAEGKKPWGKKPGQGAKRERWGPGGPNSGRKPGDFMSKPGGFRQKPGGGYRGR